MSDKDLPFLEHAPTVPLAQAKALFIVEFPFTLFEGMEVKFIPHCEIPAGKYALVPVTEEK